MSLQKAKVIKNESLTDDVFLLTVESEEIFQFMAGQYITIKISGEGKPCFRAYSINSKPPDDGKTFEICIKTVEGGRGSNWLSKLSIGDTIEFMGPNGEFFFRSDPDKEIIMIATGTGIAPIKSMIEDIFSKGVQQKIHLVFGVRHIKDIIFKEYFENMSKEYGNFKFDLTLSQPESEWHGNTGRVTDFLENMDINKKTTDAYICGLKAMTDSVSELLKKKGLKEEAIHFEKYD